MNDRYEEAVRIIVDMIGEQYPDSPYLRLKSDARKALDGLLTAMRAEYRAKELSK